jgi:ribosome-binding factor A
MLARRLERAAKEFQKEISLIILKELADPRVGFVTITRVVPAPDLKSAKVYVSVIGDAAKKKESLDCLNHASGYIQNFIGNSLRLKDIPKLLFLYDDDLEKQLEINKIIEELEEKEKKT